jgi:hypothetical protein
MGGSSPQSEANAEKDTDPFAVMDAISVGITSEKTIPSISPSPSSNGRSKVSSDPMNAKNGDDRNAMNPKSDMEAALDESRRRRTIDPRTHG